MRVLLQRVSSAIKKLATLRVFSDSEGRMNLDIAAAKGAFLVVSQFTLAGSLQRAADLLSTVRPLRRWRPNWSRR